MRTIPKIFVAWVVMAAIGAPGVWASHQATTVVIADDGDLTISWQAHAYTDDVRLRLYTVDAWGSQVLLAEETARRGIKTFSYMDHRTRSGLPVQYKLCVVTPDSEETILGVITCFEPNMADGGADLGSKSGSDVATSALVGTTNPLKPMGKTHNVVTTGGGPGPLPEVPPPRQLSV
ncbi:MAG: hypothetical protein K8R59_00140 [Thermoanaerobaculales bacterium]|nr:hypothetical protein [Thermoanaerobaculales bacterium]